MPSTDAKRPTRTPWVTSRIPLETLVAVRQYAADQGLRISGAVRELVEIALRHLGRLP